MGFDFGINKLYDKAGYFDKYGVHFIVLLLILFIWVSLLLYFQIRPSMQEIKNDWNNRKCDVKIMPIAGFINSPPGVSPLKHTKDNFNACMFNLLGPTAAKSVGPAYEASGGILGMFSFFFGFLNVLRNMLHHFREKLLAFYRELVAKFNSLALPVKKLGDSLKNLLQKIQTVATIILYKVIVMYYSTMAFSGSLIQGLTGGLFVGAGTIMGLAAFIPWTLPIVLPLFIIYVIYAILSIIINTGMAALIRGIKGDKAPNYLF